MKNKDVKKLEKEYEIQARTPRYLYKHIDDRISENIILSCFKGFKHDKGRSHILSTINN